MRWPRAGCGVLLALFVGCASPQAGPATAPAEPPAAAFSHAPFDAVLAGHVDREGRVDYAGLVREPGPLDGYVAALAATSPDSDPARFPDAASRLAYWINAYNASVLRLVRDHHPVASVEDVPGPTLVFFLPGKVRFFLFQRVTLGGATTSLYALENFLIRRRFADPRIHFALNCASVGCPRLPQHAFHPETLDAELEAEARRFVAEPRNVRIDDATASVGLSAIFDWYEEDFTGPTEPGGAARERRLLDAVAGWATPEVAEALRARAQTHRITFLPYDWALNDQRPAAP